MYVGSKRVLEHAWQRHGVLAQASAWPRGQGTGPVLTGTSLTVVAIRRVGSPRPGTRWCRGPAPAPSRVLHRPLSLPAHTRAHCHRTAHSATSSVAQVSQQVQTKVFLEGLPCCAPPLASSAPGKLRMYARLAHSSPAEGAGLEACSTGSRGRTDGGIAQVGRGVVGRALHALQRGLQIAPLAGLRQRLHLAQQRLRSGLGQRIWSTLGNRGCASISRSSVCARRGQRTPSTLGNRGCASLSKPH